MNVKVLKSIKAFLLMVKILFLFRETETSFYLQITLRKYHKIAYLQYLMYSSRIVYYSIGFMDLASIDILAINKQSGGGALLFTQNLILVS